MKILEKNFHFGLNVQEIENNIFEEYKNILNREIPKIDENSNNEKYLLIFFMI